jgi:hypothetical protein
MIINDTRAKSFLQALYYVAEKDKNDVIANAASALAVRFETPSNKGFSLSEVDQRIIRYAVNAKSKVAKDEKSRRKTYKRRVTLA